MIARIDRTGTSDEAKERVIKLMVSYQLTGAPEEDKYDERIEAAVGTDNPHVTDGGAGSGFGGRDLDWHFDDLDAAYEARDRVEALGIPGLTIGVYDSDDFDEEDREDE